jgi:cyclohexyl-isocyanide hydratase
MSDVPVHIGFVLFPGLTQLDFTGPLEVLWRVPGAVCHLLAHEAGPIESSAGLTVLASRAFRDSPQLDVLCVPGGGDGHLRAMQDETLLPS